MERIGEIAAFEISKGLEFKEIEISTPLDKIMVKEIAVQPVITTILRAGVPLLKEFLIILTKQTVVSLLLTENTMPMIISLSNKIILLVLV